MQATSNNVLATLEEDLADTSGEDNFEFDASGEDTVEFEEFDNETIGATDSK